MKTVEGEAEAASKGREASLSRLGLEGVMAE